MDRLKADRTVFLFPGQGSQHPGMGRELYESFPEARRLIDRASEVSGLDLPRLMFNGLEEELVDPAVTQVAVYTVSTATAALLSDRGIEPWAVAGHSLGEYSALVAAGCLEWEAALEVVGLRGRAMAEAGESRPGAMAYVLGLPLDMVEEMCHRTAPEGGVALANRNAPHQSVVAGEVSSVDRLVEVAWEEGATGAGRLPVGGAFHTPLMASAQETLAPAIDELPLRPPQRLLLSSVTGEPVVDVEAYRESLRRQITGPVRWRAAMAEFVASGATRFIEVGPGKVLCGLVRSNARGSGRRPIATTVSKPDECEALLAS